MGRAFFLIERFRDFNKILILEHFLFLKFTILSNIFFFSQYVFFQIHITNQLESSCLVYLSHNRKFIKYSLSISRQHLRFYPFFRINAVMFVPIFFGAAGFSVRQHLFSRDLTWINASLTGTMLCIHGIPAWPFR